MLLRAAAVARPLSSALRASRASPAPHVHHHRALSTGAADGRRVALIKIGGDVAGVDGRDAFARVCARLVDAGVAPVVVHGGGPQMNDELAAAGIEPQYAGGHRVTTADTLGVATRRL